MKVESSKSAAELLAGREVLRAWLTSLRASFTVSLLGGLPVWCLVCFVCWLLGRFLFVLFVSGILPCFCSFAYDAQGRHLSKTVTIVMMSAAQEQKKRLIGCATDFTLHVIRSFPLCLHFVVWRCFTTSCLKNV